MFEETEIGQVERVDDPATRSGECAADCLAGIELGRVDSSPLQEAGHPPVISGSPVDKEGHSHGESGQKGKRSENVPHLDQDSIVSLCRKKERIEEVKVRRVILG